VNGCCLTPKEKKFSYAMARTSYLIRRDDDDVRFVQDHHAFFHLYSAISLTQHVSPVGHIILIPSQQDFDFFFISLMLLLNGEATNTNFIVFHLTRPWLEPTIYHTRFENANYYTTDAVYNRKLQKPLKTL
jgi:hypothetical protein